MGTVVGGRFVHACAWKWSEERVLLQVCALTGHDGGRVVSIAFSPVGKRFVTGSWDKLVKVWDAATGAEVSSFVGVQCGEASGYIVGVPRRFCLESGLK